MDRRTFLQTAAAGLAASRAHAEAPQSGRRPPNVLLILPDEWRAQALGCMGNADVHTPNLDRLAGQGTLFRHTLANTPVCCPARANILTGTYTSRNGMVANDLRLRESARTMAGRRSRSYHSHATFGPKPSYNAKFRIGSGHPDTRSVRVHENQQQAYFLLD